jgi:glycosyltransferase involved in cell wall biosynthesis
MSYTIVVATRNRLDALRLSIPRMLEQAYAPAQLIVVDSSDDHEPVAEFIRSATKGKDVAVETIHSARGLTLQRNVGLERVRHPLVFFPDDDSIWFPGVAEAIMAVYERDTAGAISAVCAYESLSPPPGFLKVTANYTMSKVDRVKQPLILFRSRIEDRLFPDPGRVLARSLIANAHPPSWLKEANISLAGWMTGFRMTFRTEVARRIKFDENLTRYSLFEDRDASYGAWREGAVVATPAARVFHYRSPERRDSGRRMGATQLLNLAYIIAKHTPVGNTCRKHLLSFARYKCLLYFFAARDTFGRDRLSGARSALRELPAFVRTPPEKAAEVYTEALSKCLPN